MATQTPDWWARGTALVSLTLSVVVAARQVFLDLPRVRIHTHFGTRLSTGASPVEAGFVYASVINVSRRPIVINNVVVVGKAGIREPESWINQFPFTLKDGDTKTLALFGEPGHPDYEDAPGPGDLLAAQDSAGRWWPRRRRLRVWWATRNRRKAAREARKALKRRPGG